jgi:putative flippase GtrA
MDYKIANILSIVLASVVNFMANDRWTFKQKPGDKAGDKADDERDSKPDLATPKTL